MPVEPGTKRAIAFIDGQNLFHAIKDAFGCSYPNYDVLALSGKICEPRGWSLAKVHFYTGIPSAQENPTWNSFWTAKLAVMGTRGVETFSRPLGYRDRQVSLPNGSSATVRVGEEKGVDIRLALDVVRLARRGAYDVAVIFSQDQDLSEVAHEVRAISIAQNRWIKVACAFPANPRYTNTRGIDRTEWIRFDRELYNQCVDPIDYRRGAPPIADGSS